jgi:hypothetical protein
MPVIFTKFNNHMVFHVFILTCTVVLNSDHAPLDLVSSIWPVGFITEVQIH